MHVDSEPLDPQWSSPPAVGRRMGRRLVALLLSLALIAALAGVWALGGFKQRSDTAIRLEAPVTVKVGAVETRFTHVRMRYDDDMRKWSVEVAGTCKNWTDKAATGFEAGNLMAIADPLTQKTYDIRSLMLGSDRTGDSRIVANPGTPAVGCVATTDIEDPDFKPAGLLTVGIFASEYADRTVTKNGNFGWHSTGTVYVYYLPVYVEDVKF